MGKVKLRKTFFKVMEIAERLKYSLNSIPMKQRASGFLNDGVS